MRSLPMRRLVFTWLAALGAIAPAVGRPAIADENEKVFRAGAHAIDITPQELPVLVNGGMYTRSSDKIVDRLHARAIVLDDGKNQIAIVVVDSCMLPRALLDEAKQLASKATGIPTQRMLISATHTHSAPAAMGCLGTDADEKYAKFLPARIARGIQLAHDNLEPAQIGWAKSNDPKNVYNRRWLMKEGTAATNPFSGKTNDRAQMNPGNNNPNKIKQTGTVDDEVWVFSVQSKEGRPIALLANYSTHYAGSPALSSDYFGVFAEKIAKLMEADQAKPSFVGIMSNGTSGDTNCVDFTRGDPRKFDYHSVAEDTAQAAFEAYGKIKYFDWVEIAMEEAMLTLDVRMPTANEVAAAKEFLATDEGKRLRSVPAVYARETVLLSEMPATRELKLQAIRLGELGITAIPNEVYTITGQTIKKESPLPATFTIELANGAEGYIPPPDQHKLGGYTTWRARTSCLEEEAEPKIRAKVMESLRSVAKPASGEHKLPESAPTDEKNAERDTTLKQGANAPRSPEFRAGAYAIDVTPTKFPVVVNGMFTERTATGAADKLHARCLVLDDGKEKIAIVIVDNLMMPRELIDEAKQLAAKSTGIPVDKMLIAATHTHSAPSVMGCLGSGVDPEYGPLLVKQIVRGIEQANERLEPAQAGFAVVQDREHTHCRRWLTRPDRVGGDPFGDATVRAMMHPGYQNASYVGPAGPVDSGLSVLSIQTADGKPLAVLANYSMHYFGSPLVSADYFGRFCEQLQRRIESDTKKNSAGASPSQQQHPLVAIMSQGTSGDLHWMDYGQPQKRISLDEYSRQVAEMAFKAYQTIEYRKDVKLAMAEAKLKLRRRTPDEIRLAWAREMVEKLGDRKPQSRPEIYAWEAVYLHDEPERELVLQAVRIGEVGIAAIPDEVYGITGLKIKRQSPLAHTFNIELANGAEGYIPPPEQHTLGGYTTWPARSAGLEVQAEPQIVETVLSLLEEVADRPRRAMTPASCDYATAVLASKPLAYWRLDEIAGSQCIDVTGNEHAALYEDRIARWLDGVPLSGAGEHPDGNRAPQFAGGRLSASPKVLGKTYSVEFWFENRLPNDARAVTAYLFSRGPNGDKDAPGDHLGIMGTHDAESAGRMMFFNGNKSDTVLIGKSVIAPYTWNHLVLVRDGRKVRVYLNGRSEPEIDGEADVTIDESVRQIFFAGRSDNFANLAGKLDEPAVYNRALSTDEIAKHYAASGERKLPESASTDKNDFDRGKAHNKGADAPRSPVSPEDSVKYLHVRPGMKVELVAAEPLIRDPVAFDWGADGKLWVVEYLDYPTGIDGKGKGGGRVVFLEDVNDDGRYDKSTMFIDGLNFPTGVMAWRKGVLITAAPDILYAEDIDGDGKADKVDKLYTGFHEANQQLRVNGLRWGLDNWIYCASGSHHAGYGAESKIKSTKTGELVHIGARDFRIQPAKGLIEPVSGPSQFGRNRDAWGNWFGTQNARPMFHYVLEDRYLQRNPHVTYPDSKVLISDVPGQRPVFPRSTPGKFHHVSQAGRFTSANSAMIYCDELLGKEFIGNSFVSEPVHNLVHREIVERERRTIEFFLGPGHNDSKTFTSHKPKDEENAEFLASEDTWFRPTTIRTGPDGALWVADMYREIIEHPRWVSEDLKSIVDVRTGTDRGRIYRIYPEGTKPRKVPRVDKLDGKRLVALLESPNMTLRDMGHMRIVAERPDNLADELEKLVKESQRSETRLQALCALDGLGALDDALLQQALAHYDPWLCRQALRISESRAAALERDIIGASHAKGLLRDTHDHALTLQLAFTLGELDSPESARCLRKIADSNFDDPLMLAAVLSSLHAKNIEEFSQLMFLDWPAHEDFVRGMFETAIALKKHEVVLHLALCLTRRDSPIAKVDKEWQMRSVAVLRRILTQRGMSVDEFDKSHVIRKRLEAIVGDARDMLWNKHEESSRRVAALNLITSSPRLSEDDLQLIAERLAPQAPGELQSAAVSALSQSGNSAAPDLLLSDWKGHSPRLRSEILDALLSRGAWTQSLLAAMEKREVAAADIDAARRERLLKSANQTIRTKAAKLFAGGLDEDRAKIVSRFEPLLSSLSTGDPSGGKEIFAKRCAACHRVDNVGNEVGPDLAGLTDKSPAHLLTSILDPNRAVEPKYVSYTAILQDGRLLAGMLADESGGSLTLLDAEGKRHTLLRRDLDELKASGKSLMPEGLEQDISPDDMRDLLVYLQKALNAK